MTGVFVSLSFKNDILTRAMKSQSVTIRYSQLIKYKSSQDFKIYDFLQTLNFLFRRSIILKISNSSVCSSLYRLNFLCFEFNQAEDALLYFHCQIKFDYNPTTPSQLSNSEVISPNFHFITNIPLILCKFEEGPAKTI